MDRPHNREKVTRAFNEHLRRDRSKAAVTRISELGLVEMTRKRTRESLLHTLTEPCAALRGQGLHEVPAHGGVRAAARAAAPGRPDRGGHGHGRGSPGRRPGAGDRPTARSSRSWRSGCRSGSWSRRGGSFHIEDFEIRSPGEKAPIEKSEVAAGGAAKRRRAAATASARRRRRRTSGSPAEVEAALAEEEAASAVRSRGARDAEASADGAIRAGGATPTALRRRGGDRELERRRAAARTGDPGNTPAPLPGGNGRPIVVLSRRLTSAVDAPAAL